MKKLSFFILTKLVGLYLNGLSYIKPELAKRKAYTLFSTPRKGRLKNKQLPRTLLYSTKESFTYKNETLQTYLWEGDATILLLVHGWESNSSRWKKMLPHLKSLGHTIIAVDAPAHGLSEGKEFNAPKYAEYLHVVAQKYAPTVVIGHSIGGAAVTFYLNKYKNPTVEKVILLGAPSQFKVLSDNFIALLSLNKRIKGLLELYYYQKFAITIDDFAGHKFAENFTYKALIAHDVKDKIVPVTEGRHYASTWKNANYIETHGLGHSMHDHHLYSKIIAFIKEN
jgi:pimeloyl-ACP methyl ester carboxylesterase